MSGEAIAQRVIRVIAKNKKMAPEELSPATRFDNLKMPSSLENTTVRAGQSLLEAGLHSHWREPH